MPRQVIDLTTIQANGKKGESAVTAFTKINSMTQELYNVPGMLGFTPVQQGTGSGQLSNVIKIGWNGTFVTVVVDATNFGAVLTAGYFASAITFGAVGSYAFLRNIDNPAAITVGQNVNGSTMAYSDTLGNVVGRPTGTWRCHGYMAANSVTSVSLFQRIA